MQGSQEMPVPCLDWEDPLEEEMATHSSIRAWETRWTEEPGRLQSMGLSESDRTEHTLFNPVQVTFQRWLETESFQLGECKLHGMDRKQESGCVGSALTLLVG